MKKNPFTLHVNMDSFLPATEEEKAYMVQMRPSTTFFKDGMKRLFKNKIATISLIIIVLTTLSALIIPSFWPYSYDTMLGVRPGKPVDASYNNLAPFHYGTTERVTLLGNANVQEYFLADQAAAEELLAAYQAGDKSSEAFTSRTTRRRFPSESAKTRRMICPPDGVYLAALSERIRSACFSISRSPV